MSRGRRHPPRRAGIFYRLRGIWLSLLVVLMTTGVLLIWFEFEADRVILSEAQLLKGPGLVRDDDRAYAELVIPYGTSAPGIAALIRQSGLDIHEGMFLLHARWMGLHRQLHAGVYYIEPGVSKRQLLLRLGKKDKNQIEFRVVEGWTARQVLDAYARTPGLDFDLGGPMSPKGLAVRVGLDAGHPEGWIYPEAYLLPKGFKASTMVRRAVVLQQQTLERLWNDRDPDLPYRNEYEALIIASIVEKETQFPGDRERVAAVFANRVRLGMPLQADPTVIYGLGQKFDGRITRQDLRTDTPYNTYTRKTLPPTPIANPGRLALRAVMKPAPTQDLFFVARGDGSSEFSETLKEHNNAVNRYIRRLTGTR